MPNSWLYQFLKTSIVVAFTATYSICNAQSVNDSISVTKIETVQLFRVSTKDIIPVQTLQGATLEKLNSHSVADALRYFSGVQFKDYGGVGGLKTIDVRSMGSQHVGVFYDGIQLGNAQNGVVDLGKYSLDDLEVISLYNGQKSSYLQSAKDYASSSSIYLQSKKPVFKEGKKTNLTAKFKTGTIQLVNPSFRIEHKLSENVNANLSAEYIKSNGQYKFRYSRHNADGSVAYDTTAIRKDGQIEAKRIELGINGSTSKASWNIKGYGYESDRGIPGAIVRNHFGARGQTLVDKNYFVQGSYQIRFGKLESKLNAKWAYDQTKYTDTVTTIKVRNQYLQKELYVSWSTVYRYNKRFSTSFSADYQYNTLDANLKNFSYPTRNSYWLALATSYQDDYLSVQGSVLGTFVQEKVELNTKSPNKAVWQPSVLLNYKPSKEVDFSVRGFYKKAFRMPTFNDLYYTNIGYSNLKPEMAVQYNLGAVYRKSFDHFINAFEIQTDVYYNEVLDKIIAAPNGSMFRWMMMNLGKVKIKGLDAKAKVSWHHEDFTGVLGLNYTYQKAQDFSSPKDNFYKHQIPYVPFHSGSFTTQTQYRQWGFNYSVIYVGERYDANQNNIQYNYVKPWYTHDFSVSKEWNWQNTSLKTSIEMSNVFNQYYDVVLNYPMPGRQLKCIISIQL